MKVVEVPKGAQMLTPAWAIKRKPNRTFHEILGEDMADRWDTL